MSDLDRRALEARVRALELALRRERTAHIAVATAVLDTADDPRRFVERLEAMARGVVRDSRTPQQTKDAVLAARDLFRRTVEQRTGRPQQLFEPDVGHVSPAAASALAAMREEQLTLDDPRDAHADVTAANDRLRDAVLAEFKTRGPLIDPELWGALAGRAPRERVFTARVELTRNGRLTVVNRRARNGQDWPVYDLIERSAR